MCNPSEMDAHTKLLVFLHVPYDSRMFAFSVGLRIGFLRVSMLLET